MLGRTRVRATTGLIAKEDAIGKRELGWDIFNAFVRQLNAVVEKHQISRFRHDATSYEGRRRSRGQANPPDLTFTVGVF